MILLSIFGLVLPGFVIARAVRTMGVGGGLSALVLLLGEAVIGCAIASKPIRFGTILSIAICATVVGVAVGLATWYRRRDSEGETSPLHNAPRRGAAYALSVAVGVVVVLVLAGTSLRTTLYPLSVRHTPFRWERSCEMLEQKSLNYYPPVTAEDFEIYTYPDGIPPLVASVYWWLYAARGTPWPAITSVAIVLQQASCFYAVFLLWMLFGLVGGLLALATLAGSSLFNSGVAMGQDSGYTALSCAGQLAFAFAAAKQPRLGLAIMTGLFAAQGAIARDYGPALALCGLVALSTDSGTAQVRTDFLCDRRGTRRTLVCCEFGCAPATRSIP